ncbi:IS3 family transposase [Peribacillus frigoritolerans]
MAGLNLRLNLNHKRVQRLMRELGLKS